MSSANPWNIYDCIFVSEKINHKGALEDNFCHHWSAVKYNSFVSSQAMSHLWIYQFYQSCKARFAKSIALIALYEKLQSLSWPLMDFWQQLQITIQFWHCLCFYVVLDVVPCYTFHNIYAIENNIRIHDNEIEDAKD